MKILVDNEAKNIITQMADITLKAGGVQNLQAVNTVLSVMAIIPEAEPVGEELPEKKQ